jgi:hypothetical protein
MILAFWFHSNGILIEAELNLILQWIRNRKMITNVNKTKEIVFRRPPTHCTDVQASLVNIDKVEQI